MIGNRAVADDQEPRGVPKSIAKYGKHNPISASDEANMIALYESGHSTTEIAEEFGICALVATTTYDGTARPSRGQMLVSYPAGF